MSVKVAVTGLGMTTPLGGDTASTWAAMLRGLSGVRALQQDWAAELPVRIAAVAAVDPGSQFDRIQLRRMDRSEQFALVAAREAWADSGVSGVDPERLAVAIGTGVGGVTTLFDQDDVRELKGARFMSPHTLPMIMPNGSAGWVGMEFGAKAGVHTVVSACATGSEAIAQGLDIIRSGRADVVIAGGTEAAIHPSPLGAFASMRALSHRNDEPARASRPFDKGRDGFVLGEGAGVLILERADRAHARGARVYAYLVGAGLTSDSYHMVAPDPTGAGAARAISLALADGWIDRREVVHVNAHATSTALGDLAELNALRSAIGEHAAICAPKSMLGHLVGAAGAVESIATILSIVHGVIPATINLDDPDNELDLDVVTGEPREMPVPVAVNNSFGFGGHNVALVFTQAAG